MIEEYTEDNYYMQGLTFATNTASVKCCLTGRADKNPDAGGTSTYLG